MLPGHHEALIRRGRRLHLAEVPTELPKSGGLLIAMRFVGVCGTDLQILNGSRPDTAEILGHEGIGRVVRSEGFAPIRPGEQVIFNPAAHLAVSRILGHNSPGLFQRYFTVNSKDLEAGLILVARGWDPAVCGALVEPLGSVIYAHELIFNRIPHLRTVVVFGAGPIGLLAAAYLGSLGIRVLLVHSNPARLNTAHALGIVNRASALVLCDDIVARLAACNAGAEFDAALICTTRVGAAAALRYAVESVRHGGCIDLVTNYPETAVAPHGIDVSALRAVRAANINGVPREGAYVTGDIAGRCLAFTSHRGTSHAHLKCALNVLQGDALKYERLITHVLPLRGAASAIQGLSESRSRRLASSDCIKAVIDMTARQ